METDIRYYRRRAREEMNAARRAVTDAARDRRLQLVQQYVQRLEALGAEAPEHKGGIAQQSRAYVEECA